MEINNPRTRYLCALDALPEHGTRGFTLKTAAGTISLFIVRSPDGVYAYHNRCPHVGTPLDWQPDQFLDITETLIQCATHGALFRIADGLCIHGPCVNQSLSPVAIEVRDNAVFVILPTPPP